LKPLTWIFGEKCWHDAYGYVCFGGGGIHFCAAAAAVRRRCGGGGAAAPARRRLLKGVCLCAKKFFDVVLRWLLTQLGLLGGHWKRKVEQGFKLLSAVPPEPKTHLSLVD
jgi:hypothetical protein